jgi:hypothetical protein
MQSILITAVIIYRPGNSIGGNNKYMVSEWVSESFEDALR